MFTRTLLPARSSSATNYLQRRRDDNKNKICGSEGQRIIFRDGETTIKIKFAVLRGVTNWGQRGKSSKRLFFFFHGKRHDNKILKVQILLSRNFVVIAPAPISVCYLSVSGLLISVNCC